MKAMNLKGGTCSVENGISEIKFHPVNRIRILFWNVVQFILILLLFFSYITILMRTETELDQLPGMSDLVLFFH